VGASYDDQSDGGFVIGYWGDLLLQLAHLAVHCRPLSSTTDVSRSAQKKHARSHGKPDHPQICACSPNNQTKHHFSSYHFMICIVTQAASLKVYSLPPKFPYLQNCGCLCLDFSGIELHNRCPLMLLLQTVPTISLLGNVAWYADVPLRNYSLTHSWHDVV